MWVHPRFGEDRGDLLDELGVAKLPGGEVCSHPRINRRGSIVPATATLQQLPYAIRLFRRTPMSFSAAVESANGSADCRLADHDSELRCWSGSSPVHT